MSRTLPRVQALQAGEVGVVDGAGSSGSRGQGLLPYRRVKRARILRNWSGKRSGGAARPDGRAARSGRRVGVRASAISSTPVPRRHLVGRASWARRGAESRPQMVNALFFRTTFRVMGHIAKADGRVSEQEIASARAVMHALHLTPDQMQVGDRAISPRASSRSSTWTRRCERCARRSRRIRIWRISSSRSSCRRRWPAMTCSRLRAARCCRTSRSAGPRRHASSRVSRASCACAAMGYAGAAAATARPGSRRTRGAARAGLQRARGTPQM